MPFIPKVLPPLFEYCESPEEGIRNVVAECLGKLALMDPRGVLPRLQVSGPLRPPFPLSSSEVVGQAGRHTCRGEGVPPTF